MSGAASESSPSGAALVKFIGQRALDLSGAGIDQARTEIEMILCHLLECDRLDLYLNGPARLDDALIARVDAIIAKRKTRYPLQYILGESWFYGRRFAVNPAVMVPTPETEQLCEIALSYLRQPEITSPRVLELGVGSGVISVTLAAEYAACRVTALDVSPDAIEVARGNAEAHNVAEHIEFRRSDLFAAVRGDERYDLFVSNPPYIADSDYATVPPEVKADPKISLLGGTDGLDIVRVIVREAPSLVKKGGRIMFEIGFNQGRPVAELCEASGLYEKVTIVKDLNDYDRIVVLTPR